MHPEDQIRLIELGSTAVRVATVLGLVCTVAMGTWQSFDGGMSMGILHAVLYLIVWRVGNWIWHRVCYFAADIAGDSTCFAFILLIIHFSGEVLLPLGAFILMATRLLCRT